MSKVINEEEHAKDAALALKQKAQRKAESKEAEAEAERKANEAADDGTEQTEFDI